MPWFSSATVTRFVHLNRQVPSVTGTDGRYYFDVPGDLTSVARQVGLEASGPPPEPPVAPPWFDEDALADKVFAKIESGFAHLFQGVPRGNGRPGG